MRSVPRSAAAGLAGLALLGLTGCADDAGAPVDNGVEPPARLGPPVYEGDYGRGFYDAVDTYDGETVTLTAAVDDVITEGAFTVLDPDDMRVVELLVFHRDSVDGLAKGSTVQVTGTIHKVLDLPAIEEATGMELDGNLFDDYGTEPYLQAESVAVTG